mgnify:FL=1
MLYLKALVPKVVSTDRSIEIDVPLADHLEGMLAVLTSSAFASSNCFDFPDRSPSFSPDSYVHICEPMSGCGDVGLGLRTGAVAPSFTLSTSDGANDVTLATLLATKPVLVEFGSFT